MDPVSHAALGTTLLALWRDRPRGRALVTAAALGALAPDVDAVLMPFGWDRYLRVHEIGTHSLAGAAVVGLITAAVVRGCSRAAGMRPLSAAATAGALGHLALDLVSSAQIRLFWPLDDRPVSLPLVAMADPWLAGLLLAGAAAAFWRPRGRALAALGLAAPALFLALKAAAATRALQSYEDSSGKDGRAVARIVEAKWASLSEWHVMDRTPDRLRSWQIDAGAAEATLLLSWPLDPESPLEIRSRALSSVRNFLRVHRLGFAVTVPQAHDRVWVLWSDIRYCWNAPRDSSPRLEPSVARGDVVLSCALWFGGEFDGSGRPLRELVKIFGFTQTRAPDV